MAKGEVGIAKWDNLMALQDRMRQHEKFGRFTCILRDPEEVVANIPVLRP